LADITDDYSHSYPAFELAARHD